MFREEICSEHALTLKSRFTTIYYIYMYCNILFINVQYGIVSYRGKVVPLYYELMIDGGAA